MRWAESAARPGWLGWTLHSEATAARRQGRSDKALRLFSAALEQFRLQGDRLGEIEALNDRATLLRRGGSLYQALDGHTRALQLARELGLPGPIAESLAKIARIYAELDDLEPAADFYRQAMAAADPADPGELAELQSDLAGIHLRQGQLDAAVSATDRSIALAERSGNPAVLGTAYGRRARVLLQQGRAAEALDWIDWRYRAVQRLHRALQQSAQALQQAARTDPLTGLGYRQAIPDARALAAVAAQRGERLGVILIDLDHFKRINDEHGHLMGDQVLQAVASALRLALPAELQLVRWGGEEFLACGSFRDREHALAVAESLRRAVRAHPPRDSVHAPSISLGVSLAEPPVEAWDGLIREADRALYAAKESGRNRVCMAAAA